MLQVGQTLTIIPLNEENEKYHSKILDISKDHLYISSPANEKTKRTTFLPLHTEYQFIFVTRKNEAYGFVSEITDRVIRSLPLLQVTRPKKEEIRRIQRRQFVRVQRALDVALHSKYNEFPPLHTVTKDISAGGASLIVPKKLALVMDQQVIIWLVLPWENGKYDYLQIDARIVRIAEYNQNNHLVSVQFTDVPMNDEQLLLRFCFETQLLLRRQKGIHQ